MTLNENMQALLILAITAFVDDQVTEKCRECGFDDVIQTPLNKSKILTKIIEQLQKRRLATEEAAMQNQQVAQLLSEDNL